MLLKALFVFLLARLAHCADYSNGFGDAYNWKSTLDEAIAEGKKLEKPVIVIIHASWCGWSQKLKGKVASSDEIQELSKDFVFVNVLEEDVPKDPAYRPDGDYFPRILFICKGKIMPEIINEEKRQSKYSYSKAEHIAASMKRALATCV